MAIHKLSFDTTDAESIADSANVGAYLRSSDGTLLTHTDVGGKQALDVRIAEGINVEVDLDHADDSVRLGDGTDLFTSTTVNTDIGLDVYIINEDLDIRDLTAASDSVASWLSDGSGNAITSTGNALDVNIASGSVTVNDAALADTAIATAANNVTVANTSEDLVASPLASRKYLFVYNEGNKEVYIGASGVTATTGFPVPPQAILELRAGASIDIEFVGKSGASGASSTGVRTMELS